MRIAYAICRCVFPVVCIAYAGWGFAQSPTTSDPIEEYVWGQQPTSGTLFKPYIAAEIFRNDGAFKNPNDYNRYNILTKFNLFSTANSSLNFLGTFFKTDWNASGELPSRQVRSSEIGRFGSNDPSEGGKSARQNLSFIYNYTDANQSFTAQTWVS